MSWMGLGSGCPTDQSCPWGGGGGEELRGGGHGVIIRWSEWPCIPVLLAPGGSTLVNDFG